LQDVADLAAADADALGLGGSGQGVQGPLRRLVGILGPVKAETPIGLADKPAGRVASGQGDDPTALQLPSRRGRPERGRSPRPSMPLALKRCSQR
jgi:hypothetical protein